MRQFALHALVYLLGIASAAFVATEAHAVPGDAPASVTTGARS